MTSRQQVWSVVHGHEKPTLNGHVEGPTWNVHRSASFGQQEHRTTDSLAMEVPRAGL